MRCSVIAVGHARQGPYQDLFDEYARRVLPPLDLVEVEERRSLPEAALKDREAELLLAAAGRDAKIVLLDETGTLLGTAGFAQLMQGWRDSAVRRCAFLIGGAAGHGAAARAAADYVLSLGPMTWPHLLVRGMLAEQIYRAQTISVGHPYHRA